MAQKFSDAARATLVSGITAGDTSLTLNSGNAFPVANTGTSAISESADWFKLVLQDASKFEIVYARTHALNASVISDLLRGQEGTTASAFAATSVVGLRQTALDAVQYAATKVSLDTHVGSGGAAHADATGSVDGFMSAADKTKLDGVAAGATNYAHPANHPASIITQDASNRFVTDAEKTTWNAKQAAGNYATGGGTATGTNTGDQSTITGNAGTATALSAGADRTKLDAITGANTGDETGATIRTKLGVTTLSGSNTGDQVLPTTLPASDVYAWAKAINKPSYTATEVGLGNVDNTADSAKPVSTAQQTALDLKANLASPTFTGTVSGITAAMVGAQPAGTYATGPGSATGANTGDQTITLTGEATGSGTGSFAVTVPNATVIGKVLTGYVSGAGTVAATDTILQAVNKLNGNDGLKQDALVSNTNIKTVNSTSLLGSGNIVTGDVTLTGVQTLTNKTITDIVFALTGTTPAFTATNGGVQTWTLTAASTPTSALTSGQSIILVITPGANTITWPAGTIWTKQGGSGAAPTLFSAGKTSVVLWMVGSQLYGSHLGDTV